MTTKNRRNVMKFKRSLRIAAEELVETEVVELGQEMALETLGDVVVNTPRDQGIAQAGWQTTINYEPNDDIWLASPIEEGSRIIDQAKAFDRIVISNSVPYIGVLEEGHSQQKPRGWVKLSVEKVRNRFYRRRRNKKYK